MNRYVPQKSQLTFAGKSQSHVIKRQPRKRENLPVEVVKLPRPKPLQASQQSPTWIMALPSVVMALMTAGILYATTGKVSLTILPTLGMAGMTVAFQMWMARNQRQKQEATNERFKQQFTQQLEKLCEQLENDAKLQSQILHSERPSVSTLESWVERRASAIWQRQPTDDDFLVVRIGTGTQPLSRPVQQWLDSDDDDPRLERANEAVRGLIHVPKLPIGVNLQTLSAVGVQGSRPSDALQLAYTIVLNLAVLHSPDELHIHIISHRHDAAHSWNWARWLPHTYALHQGELPPKLSFSPSQDEEVLLGLAQELRRREDQVKGNRRRQVSGPHLFIILDEAPSLRNHQIVSMVLGQRPNEEEGRLGASILFINNPIPPQVHGMIIIDSTKVSFHEAWKGTANQESIAGEAERTQIKTAEKISRAMAPLRTVEGFNLSGGGLPSSVRLVEILAGEGNRVDDLQFQQYYETSYDRRKVMSFPIGINRDLKPQYVTLRETGQKGNGQHAILAGGTGKGKSITLQSIVVSLAATHSPKYLNFILADFKGGSSELAKLQTLPHVVGFVTDLKTSYVERFRLALEGEITRRKRLFEATPQTLGQQITNIYDYNDLAPQKGIPYLPHLILVIDEFHKARELNESFQKTMDNGVAAQGRALGMHLLLSTQKAEDFGSVLPNIEVKMSMGMNRAEDSKAIFKRDEAFTLLKRPGQAYLQALQNEIEIFEMFQVARTDTDYIAKGEEEQVDSKDEFTIERLNIDGRRELLYKNSKQDQESKSAKAITKQARLSEAEVIVQRISTYCIDKQYPPMPPVCLDPLPTFNSMPLNELFSDAELHQQWAEEGWSSPVIQKRLQLPVGMIDLPEQQKQIVHWLNFNQGDGNLLVIGPQGSGKGLFVRTVLMGLCATHSPRDLQFYIMSRTPQLTVMDEFPHCGGVIRTASERERLKRGLHFILQEIERRRHLMSKERVDSMTQLREKRPDLLLPAIFLIVEEMARVREEYEDQFNDFMRIAAEAKGADLHLIISNTSMQGIPPKLADNMNGRLALGLRAVADYVDVLGKRAEVVDELLGRGYLLFEGEAREFQSAAPIITSLTKVNDATMIQHIRATGRDMAAYWKDKDNILPTVIESLSDWLDLEQLWRKTPLTAKSNQEHLTTAVVGIGYENLDPISIDLLSMDPATLVIGPKSAGKTEWLLTFALSSTKTLSPEQLEIIIISADRATPLRYLRKLPHVTYIHTKGQFAAIAEQKVNEVEKRWQLYSEQRDRSSELTTQFLMTLGLPKYTLIIVDGWNAATKLDPKFNAILDQFWKNELCRVVLADTTSNFDLIFKADYNIGTILKRYGTHVLFSGDDPTTNLLGAACRVTNPMKRTHNNQVGKGRAYFSYNNEIDVVQFGTLRKQGEEEAIYQERLEQLIQEITEANVDITSPEAA